MGVKVLDFTGKWCLTCIVLDKIIESEIMPRYKNKIKFVKVDIEEHEELIKQYEILSAPTLIILKNNKEVWRKSGTITGGEIIKELNRII